MNPQHIGKVPEFIKDDKGKDIPRRAVAPYNFVELPEKVVEAEDLPSGDRYHPERHTGRIECTLTTESPLYIRCGLTTEEFQADKEAKDLPDFFYTDPTSKSEKPVLPGSSLRGMLRTLVEIISFSKIDRVSNEHRLFFRAVASNPNKESWGQEYKKYVEPKKVKAGYLKKDNQGWYIQPAKTEQGATFAWVRETSLSLQDFRQFNDQNYHPQYIPVSYERAEIDPKDKATPKRLFAHNVKPLAIHSKNGVLVTSGNMKQGDESSPRFNHCIVFAENKNADLLRIDITAIEHYRNALTDFQKESPFDKDWGILKLEAEKDRPVFYSDPGDEDIVRFFGQSPNFRIPYSPEGNGQATTVVDFIPEDLRQLATIDLADAIFGWVKQETKDKKLPDKFDKQRAGRIFITDAIYESSKNDIWYENEPLTPQILSEPKPSYFPHYLVQPNVDKLELKHYASQPVTETVIRGHKLYWHKGSDPDFKLPKPKKVIGSTKKVTVSDTQTTLIKPINKGVTFKSDIHFENLSQVELGALLWVLSLSSDKSQTLETGKQGEKYCFSLGMGKPLGMGAVKIDYELYLSDRTSRYEDLFDENESQWKVGNREKEDCLKEEKLSVEAFEKYILDGICCQDYPKKQKREQLQHLKQLPRIEMLLAMLRCDSTPETEQTRYMKIEPENEYKHRPVLPTPLQLSDIEDNRQLNSSTSPVVKNKDNVVKSKRQLEITAVVQAQNFTVEQILEATVTSIKGNKVSYQMLEALKLTQKEPKKVASLQEGQVVRVQITALKEDGSIKSIKCLD